MTETATTNSPPASHGARRRRTAGSLVLVALLCTATLGGNLSLARPASASPAVTFADSGGIQVVSVQRIDDRDYALTLLSAALTRPVNVRIILPQGYATSTASLPVLYLYTGTGGTAADWVNLGQAREATAGLLLITVMPDIGFAKQPASGFFVDWVKTTTKWGPSQWETFQVDQLIPWIDANLRTIPSRSGRAVAGLSQGGFGSMSYAARHPDAFTSAAAFSGFVDINHQPVVGLAATAFVAGIALANAVAPDAILGSRLTRQANWAGHDPVTLLSNMRDLDLWLFTGNGIPGPLDPIPPNIAEAAIEVIAHTMTTTMSDHAKTIGVPVHLRDRGPGTHSFAYWREDLRTYLAALMPRFTSPPPDPTTISYTAAARTWSQWGWDVSLQRDCDLELTTLSNANANGFTFTGRGTATITTPPLFTPGTVVTVSTDGRSSALTADASGRLKVVVDVTAHRTAQATFNPAAPSAGRSRG